MGQAKQRGSFEQRQAEGIERRLEREEQARIDRRLREEALDRAAEARHQERARQAPRSVLPGQHSAFGRSRTMSRSLLGAVAMATMLAAPKGKP